MMNFFRCTKIVAFCILCCFVVLNLRLLLCLLAGFCAQFRSCVGVAILFLRFYLVCVLIMHFGIVLSSLCVELC